jgi:hypothetical protein
MMVIFFPMTIDDSQIFVVQIGPSLITNNKGNTWAPLISNIQPAVDDVGTPTQSNPGWVYLPAMDGIVQYANRIRLPSYFTFFGAGRNNTILRLANQANCNMIENKNGTPYGSAAGNHHITIQNMTLDCNGLNQTWTQNNHREVHYHGIHLVNCHDITVNNLYIHNPQCEGICSQWNLNSSIQDWGYNMKVLNTEVDFAGQQFEGTTSVLGDAGFSMNGIYMWARDGSLVDNCVVHDCYCYGIELEPSWESASPVDDTNWARNFTIQNCECYNNAGGIYTERTKHVTIQNNHTHNNYKYEASPSTGGPCGVGIFVAASCYDVLVQKNNSHHNYFNIRCHGFYDVKVLNNESYSTLAENPPIGTGPCAGILVGSSKGGINVSGELGLHKIIGNNIHDILGRGIGATGKDSICTSNTITNVSGWGLLVYDWANNQICYSGEVAYNTITKYGTLCINNWLTGPVYIHNNTCIP